MKRVGKTLCITAVLYSLLIVAAYGKPFLPEDAYPDMPSTEAISVEERGQALQVIASIAARWDHLLVGTGAGDAAIAYLTAAFDAGTVDLFQLVLIAKEIKADVSGVHRKAGEGKAGPSSEGVLPQQEPEQEVDQPDAVTSVAQVYIEAIADFWANLFPETDARQVVVEELTLAVESGEIDLLELDQIADALGINIRDYGIE